VTTAEFEWADRLPTLTGERVALRALEGRDVADLFAVFSDPLVMRYWDSGPLQSSDDAQALLADIDARFNERTLFQWGLARRSDDRVIGTCTLHKLDAVHRRAEVGFALGTDHWGRGLASEAVAMLIGFAFDRLNLHRLEADADPRNQRSLVLLERQGFRKEGFLRERYIVDGEIQDAVVFGLLQSEWRALHTRT
jgi:[ribosomal protein S5]-alanine N-acetyltransferase